MVVEESKNKKALENPGAEEFKIKFGGKNQGLPYWLIFDKNGNLLSDSKIRPEGADSETAAFNSGCPAAANEVAFFIGILKATTKLSPEELSIIEKRFRQNEQ